MSWPIKGLARFLAVAALGACAYTDVGQGLLKDIAYLDPQTFTCCAEPEKFYPVGPTRLAFILADRRGDGIATRMYGRFHEHGFPGRLAGNRQAEAALLARLEPLDLVFTANKSYIWGHIIPGRFSHDVIYLGTEAQLRSAELWYLPDLAPLRDDIREGRLFAEAIHPKSQIIDPARVMQSDAAAILRPDLTYAAKAQALGVLAANVGVRYDLSFDVATSDRLSCTELVNLAMPGLGVQTRMAYGREVIFPDDYVAQAIRGERIALVGYMVGAREGGYVWRNTHSLMADIAAYWGVPE